LLLREQDFIGNRSEIENVGQIWIGNDPCEQNAILSVDHEMLNEIGCGCLSGLIGFESG
jgi:hypothetical protein